MAVSIRDVAQRAGVSVGTVSNVLNGIATVGTRTAARVHAAVAELGYVRNDAARRLRAGTSTTVGLVVLDVGNPFFAAVARGAEDEAALHGLSILLGNSDENPEREATYLDLFEEQQVRGVLISPYGDAEERLARLRARGIPAVLVDRRGADAFSSVAVDDVAGGRLAVEHLLALGRRRIAFVGGPSKIRQVADRLTGARRAVDAQAGASLEVLETAALTVGEGHRMGERILGLRASERPEALFAANDLVAIGLLQALSMHRRTLVPDEIALIGYDDIDFAASAIVPLSSIRQPAHRIGATALQLLVAEAADPGLAPRHVLYQPELVVRASSSG